MPTETPNRPPRIGLEIFFLLNGSREWPKTHIPLVTESAPGRAAAGQRPPGRLFRLLISILRSVNC